jgi:signal transduction histidine kinase
MISTVESPLPADAPDADRVILCCPLLHNERCHGFLQVEGPLSSAATAPLTRRDLALATLMSHLVAGRLDDLESQHARLKLVRKATAGFLAATVGHCFKNLLFVPMSLSHMIPMCLREGKLDDIQWMLARNSVNIRYLDILSNEFAAASKDPGAGFEECNIEKLLTEVVTLINQIAPDRVQAVLVLPAPDPRLTCHPAALRRLLMNLTLNSVDAFFSANKQEVGRIEIRLDQDEARDEVCLAVQDNGGGIPAQILENLREIFRQVQASADALGELQNIAERVQSTKDQGFKEHYGLGFLFVCQTVHAHGGRMEIESVVGQGACFRIFLPRHRATLGNGWTDHE